MSFLPPIITYNTLLNLLSQEYNIRDLTFIFEPYKQGIF
jgi:hypothetical protein